MLEALRTAVAQVNLRAPSKPLVSTVTGLPMSAAQATDPAYWANHARATVQFSKAAQWLVQNQYDLFLECGPRSTLSSLVRQHFSLKQPGTAIPSLGDSHENHAESKAMLFALGSLWQNGIDLDWDAFYVHEMRRRIPLPTYVFDRKRYWVDPAPSSAAATQAFSIGSRYELLNADADAQSSDSAAADSSQAKTPKDRLTARLMELLSPISGMDAGELSSTATFLEQGFNSLSLTQVSLAVQQTFGIKVTFGQLMNQLPNVELLAAHLDQSLKATPTQPQATPSVASATTTATKNEPKEAASVEMATTAAQREVWYPSKFGATRAYNLLVEIRLGGALQLDALRAALQELVDQNDALRITISRNGERQMVHASRQQELPVLDVSELSAEAKQAQLETLIEKFHETALELSRGPLMKAQLIRLGAQEHILLLMFHHAIIDGWSTHVVAIELSRLYSAQVEGKNDATVPALQFREYVAWYESEAQVNTRAKALQYWLESYADMPAAVDLPTCGTRPTERSYRAQTLNASITPELLDQVRKTSAASNATLFHFLLASTMVWLNHITQQPCIVIGVPVAGQLAADLQHLNGCERLMGHLTTTFPIRGNIDGNKRFTELLQEVKLTLLEARLNEACTFGEIAQRLNVPSAPGSLQLVSVLLNLNDQPTMRWSGLEASTHVPQRTHMFFDLEIYLSQRDDSVDVACCFATDLFSHATVAQWLEQWKATIAAAVKQPRETIHTLTLACNEPSDRTPHAQAIGPQ
jgi:acyl transferase domain-containing protein